MRVTAKETLPRDNAIGSAVRTGFVVSDTPGAFTVQINEEIKPAQRAFSCLIDPQRDDMVICVEDDTGHAIILGIINRPESQKMTLSFNSGATIRMQKGDLNINTSDRVSIISKKLSCLSRTQIFKSHEGIFSYNKVTAGGDELQASFKSIRLISNLVNTMARQVIERFKRYVRNTEESDMVKAGHMTRQSKGLYSVDSSHTIMNSKNSTKIDGEKILMG